MIAARSGRLYAVRPLILTCFWADIWLHTLASTGLSSSGRQAEALRIGAQLPALLLGAVGLGLREESFVSVLLGFVALDACMYVISEAAAGGGGPARVISAALLDTLNGDGPYLLLALGLIAWRRFAIRRARLLLADDLHRYAAAWAAVAAADAGGLLELRAAVQAVACPQGGARASARQLCCGPHSDLSQAPGPPADPGRPRGLLAMLRMVPPKACCWMVVESPGEVQDRPIDSLDQLFAQAALLHPIVIARVRAWAAATGGQIRCGHGGREWARVGEAVGEERWARVKSVARATEKCVRCYGQVSGRLSLPLWSDRRCNLRD